MIFVNSMSDLFHKKVPFAFVDQVFDTMEKADWHVFQVLTKRSSLMRDYLRRRYGERRGPENIWCGVSVEDAQAKRRIEHLRSAQAGVRFLSIEPLIGAVGPIDLTGIDWVIAGGESGPGARPVHLEWVRDVRDQCIAQKVAFFFKQWGGIRPKSGGRELDGREWNEFPTRKAGGALIPALPVVGPWARDKLDALQRYLDFYTKVLKNQRWRTIYLDAYAGGGRAVVRTGTRNGTATDGGDLFA
jgi:protein gp37